MSDQSIDVYAVVRTTLTDALGVDKSAVTPDATLVGDLDAESIDFLDVLFRLEKKLSIRIPREELFPEDILTNAEYVQKGKINEEGIRLLKERMPFADVASLEADPKLNNFANLLTVQAVCNYLESRLASRDGK